MSSIEKSLAALLEQAVEERVKQVQAAADAVIVELRALAQRIAAGDVTTQITSPPAVTQQHRAAHAEVVDEDKAPALPAEAQQIIDGMMGRKNFDNDAINANMSVR